MGVKGLWRLLMPIGRRISIETLEGKILAIDASIWLTQFLKAMRDPDTGQVKPAAHLIGFIRRLCKLRYQGIRPVLVFDGATPEIKQREIRERRKRRGENQFATTDSQDQIQRMAKRLLSQQLKKDGSKLSIIVNKNKNKNSNGNSDSDSDSNNDSDNNNQNNNQKQKKGITTATASYAPGFYDPEMEEEKKREEEEREQEKEESPEQPVSSSDEKQRKKSSEDDHNNDEKDIIDLLNDDEVKRNEQEAQQQQSDWDNVAIVNQEEGNDNNDNTSKGSKNDIRRYTQPTRKKRKNNSKFKVDYVASLPSTERKDAVENAQRFRRLESRRQFMQVAYDMENFGQCQLRNFLKSSKLNKSIQHMARQAAINDGVDTISANDRTHKIIFTKDKTADDGGKKYERNRQIRQLQQQAKQKGLSLLNDEDETTSGGSSSSNDDEDDDVDNVFSEDDDGDDVGTKWEGKYNRKGKRGTKRRSRKRGIVHQHHHDDDDDNINWEDASSPSPASKGVIGSCNRRAIIDDGDDEEEDYNSNEDDEEQGGFFTNALTGMDSTTTVAFHSNDKNKSKTSSSKKSRIINRRSTDDDAKLAQELQDRDLAQALQDDEQNQVDGDGGRGGGGGGFFPTSSVRPEKLKSSIKQKRRRQTININDSDGDGDDDDDDKFKDEGQSDGGGGGLIIEKANTTLPTTKNVETDEGGGGFLMRPAGSSSEKAVASRQIPNVEENDDDSDEEGGGGFLPAGFQADLKKVSFASMPMRDAANEEGDDESLNKKPAARPTQVINVDDDDDDEVADDGGGGFIPPTEMNSKTSVARRRLDIDHPNDNTHTVNDEAIAQQLQDEEFAQQLQQTEYSSDVGDVGDVGGGGGFMTQQTQDGEEEPSFALAAVQHRVTTKQGPLTEERHIGTAAAQNRRANQIRLREMVDSSTDSPQKHVILRENGTGDMAGSSDEDEDLDWEDGDAEEEDVIQPGTSMIESVSPMEVRGKLAKEQNTTATEMTHGAVVSDTAKHAVPSTETTPTATVPLKSDDSDDDDIEWEDGHDQRQQGSAEVTPTSVRGTNISSSSVPPSFPRERSIDSSKEKSTDYSEEGVNDNLGNETGIDDSWGGDFGSRNSKTKDLAAALEHAQATASHLTNWAGRAFRRAVAQHAEENGLSVPEAAKPKMTTIDGTNKTMQKTEDLQNTNESILPTRKESSQPSLKSNSSRRGAEAQASIPDQLDVEATLRSLEQYQEEWKKERNQQERDMDTVTDEMRAEVMQLLHLFGIPYVEAPAEAESQCVELEKLGLVSGVVTEDSDAFVFGAQTVYKNIFEDKKYVEEYRAKDAEREMNLTHDALVALAMLLGGDYTLGVKGVGIVNGMEIVDAFDVADGLQAGLVRFRDWLNDFDPTDIIPIQKGREDGSKERDFHKKHYTARARWIAPKHFPDPKVLNAYLNPVVDTSDDRFTWGVPDLEKLVVFCNRHVGWSATETKQVLEPVIERVTHKSMQQTRIDSFMRYEDGIKFASIRSKRLRDVLSKVNDAKSAKKQKQEEQSQTQSKHFKK